MVAPTHTASTARKLGQVMNISSDKVVKDRALVSRSEALSRVAPKRFDANLRALRGERVAPGALSTVQEVAPVALTRVTRVVWFFGEVRACSGRQDTDKRCH